MDESSAQRALERCPSGNKDRQRGRTRHRGVRPQGAHFRLLLQGRHLKATQGGRTALPAATRQYHQGR